VYNRVREGNFCLEGVTPGIVLAGKTVGVLGTGNIGECFVRIMLGLGCHVLGYDVVESHSLVALQEKGKIEGGGSFEYRSLDEVLQVRSECPLSPLLSDSSSMHVACDPFDSLRPFWIPGFGRYLAPHAADAGHPGYYRAPQYQEDERGIKRCYVI